MTFVFLISSIAAGVLIVLRSAAISAHESSRMLDKYEELLAEARETQFRRASQLRESGETPQI